MKFTYTAKSINGDEKSGIQEAKDKVELAHLLRAKGYVLTSASGGRRGKISGEGIKNIRFNISLRGISLVEKLMFTRNLAVMIGAGLPLNKALGVLEKQSSNIKFKEIIEDVAKSISKGRPFSDSIADHPSAFSHLYVSMVRIGETAGNLEEVLQNLAEQLKKDHDIVSKVRGALIYPGVIFTIMLIIGYLMMILVVPQLAATFKDVGADLPASTQFIMTLSDVMLNYWHIVLFGVIIFIFGVRYILKTPWGSKMFDFMVLKTPVIKGLSIKLNSARFARTLSTLIDSGVPIVKGLEILSDTLSNQYFSESLKNAVKEVQKGKSLHEALEPYNRLYPPLVVQMIAVGEETGSLTKILAKLADFYEDEVSNVTKNLSTIIEPIMMVIIGAGVGFFAVSMITPMYSVLDNV